MFWMFNLCFSGAVVSAGVEPQQSVCSATFPRRSWMFLHQRRNLHQTSTVWQRLSAAAAAAAAAAEESSHLRTKASIWSRAERHHCSPMILLSNPVFLPGVPPSDGDFYFGFSAGGQSSAEESEDRLPCFHLFFPEASLGKRQQNISAFFPRLRHEGELQSRQREDAVTDSWRLQEDVQRSEVRGQRWRKSRTWCIVGRG